MSWKQIGLGEIATFHNGYAFKPSDWSKKGKEIIRIQNLTKGSAKINYFEGEIADKYKVRKGDILISWSGSLGVYEWEKEDSWLNQHLFKVVLNKEDLNKSFLKHLISKSLDKLEGQTHGATMKHITKKKFDAFPIKLPPLEDQKKIAAILDAADSYRQKTKALIKKYEELTQSFFLDMFGDPVTNPKRWEVKLVEEVCDKIYGGGTPSKSHSEYYEGDIPWVTPKDMKSEYITDSIDHINQIGVDNSSAKIIPKNSVLMVIRSGILKHTLPVAINTKLVTVNQDMKAYIPNSRLTNSIYLKSFFKAVSGYLLTKVRAVTADNIEFRQIKELDYICPPLDLQNQFAERVKVIEGQKAKAQTSLIKANDLFNSLMQKAFKGELVA